jgi:hypothetical protein
MRTLVALALSALALLSCKDVVPDPKEPTDTDMCATACANLNRLGCEEGATLPDGTTCEAFCINTQKSGHALDPTCMSTITSCKDIEKTCNQ